MLQSVCPRFYRTDAQYPSVEFARHKAKEIIALCWFIQMRVNCNPPLFGVFSKRETCVVDTKVRTVN